MSKLPGTGTVAERMAAAAEALFKSLNAAQREKILFDLSSEEREDWTYVPRPRKGVPLKELDDIQHQRAQSLLSAGLSPKGLTTAHTIIALEPVLREIEERQGRRRSDRDPELYFFTIFGRPELRRPWGWRVEGHHVSLNYTLTPAGRISFTPSFFGANPAEVPHGGQKGLRTLAHEEDLGRQLLKSLDGGQRSTALISEYAPLDIVSGASRRAAPLHPAGIQMRKLSERQGSILVELLQQYSERMPPDKAESRWGKLRSAGLGDISFAWAGGQERGQPHYYRIQGPGFLIEYDNTQNNANHIHTVWRDFEDDFGRDILAEHYREGHTAASRPDGWVGHGATTPHLIPAADNQ
jgi:hypothetical protein